MKVFPQKPQNLNLVYPHELHTGKRALTMNKSLKGILKVRDLEDELRMTRGNRETVLVCQGQVEKSNQIYRSESV